MHQASDTAGARHPACGCVRDGDAQRRPGARTSRRNREAQGRNAADLRRARGDVQISGVGVTVGRGARSPAVRGRPLCGIESGMSVCAADDAVPDVSGGTVAAVCVETAATASVGGGEFSRCRRG